VLGDGHPLYLTGQEGEKEKKKKEKRKKKKEKRKKKKEKRKQNPDYAASIFQFHSKCTSTMNG
jgi:hypothetical protein